MGTEERGDQPLPLSSQPNDLSIDEGAGPTAGATHPLPVSIYVHCSYRYRYMYMYMYMYIYMTNHSYKHRKKGKVKKRKKETNKHITCTGNILYTQTTASLA